MKRDYESGESWDIKFFTGVEVEHTPAFGLKTLFVTGLQDVEEIQTLYKKEKCKHIFFGANHSFCPTEAPEWDEWNYMIKNFLQEGILCSLDIPLTHTEWALEMNAIEYDNFIPQIRIPVPYVKQWNYNTMIKIDDKDFKATNPGVWCHSLHDLMDRKKFTDWSKYGLDKVIK